MLNRSEDNNGKTEPYENPLGNYSEKIILQSITHLMDFTESIDRSLSISLYRAPRATSEWLDFLL